MIPKRPAKVEVGTACEVHYEAASKGSSNRIEGSPVSNPPLVPSECNRLLVGAKDQQRIKCLRVASSHVRARTLEVSFARQARPGHQYLSMLLRLL